MKHAATISRRLNTINCEFYLRPQIGILEFGETIPVNLNYIKENLDILDQKSISGLIRETRKIEPYLKQKHETGMCISLTVYSYIDTLKN